MSFKRDPNHLNNLESIPVVQFSLPQTIIKTQAGCGRYIGKMYVCAPRGKLFCNFGQSEVMRSHQADGLTVNQQAKNSLGCDTPVSGIGSSKKLVDEKQDRRAGGCPIKDCSQLLDFSVKVRASMQ